MQIIKTINTILCESAHQLYGQVLQAMNNGEEIPSVKDPKSVGSAWGTRERPTKELRYVTLILENPQNRFINSPLFFLEDAVPRAVLATLSDEFDAQTMTFYNPKALEFSDDGKTISSNYGYRARHLNHKNQIDDVIQQLHQDPYSRRAVIHIHTPGDSEKKYAPCIDSLHFLIRDGTLECQSFWRSENALTLLPINIFEFTLFQELIASELRIPVGRYVHTVSSLHYYLEDEPRFHYASTAVLCQKPPETMGCMPFCSLQQVELLREFEKTLRLQQGNGMNVFTDLHDYWQKLAAIIAYTIAKKHCDSFSMQHWKKYFPSF